jgi:hypothetical protein
MGGYRETHPIEPYARYVVCRLCGEPLIGHESKIGVCTYCIANPPGAYKSVNLRTPSYGKKVKNRTSEEPPD